MAQHFLLSKQAKTLSLASVFQMKDEEAEAAFRRSIDLFGELGRPESVDVANVYNWLSSTYFDAGKYRDAHPGRDPQFRAGD